MVGFRSEVTFWTRFYYESKLLIELAYIIWSHRWFQKRAWPPVIRISSPLNLIPSIYNYKISVIILIVPCQAFFSHVFFPTTQTLVWALSAVSSLLPACGLTSRRPLCLIQLDFASVVPETWLRVGLNRHWLRIVCPHCLPGSSDRCDFRLLHAESEYSYVSSTPLLDYLGGVFMVFRGIGVETRIYFSSFRQITCIRGKFFIFVVCLLTLNSTMNSYSYLRYLASRTCYSISSVIHAWRIFWVCWAWMSSQPQSQNRAVSS